MQIPCRVQIDYTAGAGPGGVQATVQYVGPDGQVYHAEDPSPVKAGQSLTVGPVMVEVQLGTKAEHGETPKTGKQGSKPKAAGAA